MKKKLFFTILFILIFGEIILYGIAELSNSNNRVVVMRKDDVIYGLLGNSYLHDFKHPLEEKSIFKEVGYGSIQIVMPIGIIISTLPIPYILGVLLFKRLVYAFVLYSTFIFFKSFLSLKKTRYALISCFLIPSIAQGTTIILELLNILSLKHVISSSYISHLVQFSTYGGIAISFGFLAIANIIKWGKINYFQGFLLAISLFSHPIIASIYIGIYFLLIFYFGRYKDIHKTIIILLGLFIWLPFYSGFSTFYLISKTNVFNIQQVIYSIFILFSRLGLLFLLVIIKNFQIKKYTWTWLIFYTLLLLSLFPEEKFSLIRNSYLFYPLVVFTIGLINIYYNSERIFQSILLLGILVFLVSYYIAFTNIVYLENNVYDELIEQQNRDYDILYYNTDLYNNTDKLYYTHILTKKRLLRDIYK